MRELVYQSDRKLQQFRQDDSQWSWWRRIKSIGTKSPLGEVTITLEDNHTDKPSRLAAVLRYIDSARGTHWYEEDEVAAGEWVQFEARLNYAVLPGRVGDNDQEKRGPVLFWKPLPAPTAPDSVHLILHGSPKSLVGRYKSTEPVTVDDTLSTPHGFFDSLRDVPRLLDGITDPSSPSNSFDEAMWNLLGGLDGLYPEGAASWLAGYAQVTAKISTRTARFVVCSPLYVERVSNPTVNDGR